MIRARIEEDVFFGWSIAPERAAELAPAGLRPTLVDGEACLLLAVVRLARVRVGPAPLPGRHAVAGLMLIGEFVDRTGAQRRGNYFLELFTDSPWVVLGDRLFGSGRARRSPIAFERRGEAWRIGIGDRLDLEMDLSRGVDDGVRRRTERFLRGDHSGLISRRGRLRYSALEKDHWRMDGHPWRVLGGDLLAPYGATPSFAFDTSDNRGCWHRLREARPA